MASERISRSRIEDERVRQGKKQGDRKKKRGLRILRQLRETATDLQEKGTFALLTMLIYLSRRGYQKYRMPKVCQYISNEIEWASRHFSSNLTK